MAEYDRVSVHNGWRETIKFTNVIFYLAGTAKTWFQNNENKNDLQSWDWDTFRTAIPDVFYVASNRKGLFTERMALRSQRASDSFTAYIQDIIWLYRSVNPDILEDDKISHHMKEVA